MTIVSLSLSTAGFIATLGFLIAYGLGRISLRTFQGGIAAGNAVLLLGNVIRGATTFASISAASMALSLWLWWNNGGGDGPRRRLRSWARKFRGVRRTAPAAGS